ncbi:MAG TPA: ATP-binding protein [Caulobacteraceae bacterium]|jgi:two-component system phosphate regulon sensor histidine kinase PhoR|nr:ATP-binding protein [Caulobacteraceae bacterium]
MMAVEPLQTPRTRIAHPLNDAVAWAPLAVAAAALAGLMALVAGRSAQPVAATVAGGIVLAFAAGLGLWVRERSRASADSMVQRPALDAAAPAAAIASSSAVLEALEDPVLVVLADEPRDDIAARRLIYANAAARELFRTSRDAGPLVTAVRDPKILDVVDAALFDGLTGEVHYAAGGVQDRTWRAKAQPLGAAHHPRLALLTLHDETELRRSERTRADFLANASHELRTPLASLAGFIETLRGHARDDAAARDRFLGIMQDQAARMSRLIDDLMSLSRIELNEHIPPQGRVDVSLTLRDVIDALGPIADDKNVRFDVRSPDGPVAAKPADRDQVVQVIQNLAENALKYTPPGSPVVVELLSDVSVAEAMRPRQLGAQSLALLTPDHAADQRYVMLRVIDTGPGIAREHLPRLTERFYRVEGQKVSERPGTGLGLAIVKHIVNRHRGGMTVESAPGVGTAFCVYLPSSAEPCAPAA